MEKFLKALKNYYIVFSVCMLCVFVAALLFGIKFYNQSKVKKTALAPPPVYIESKPENEKSDNIDKKTNPLTVKNNKSSKSEAVETMAVKPKNKFEIIMPVSGEVLKEFSGDNLVYSKTFDDYRIHRGIDIKSKRSEAVLAAFDGVVENVYTDSLEGIVIEINHNNGYKSIYKNLSSDKMVKKGESVTKGQAISGVGETAIFEAEDEVHLHFELQLDGEFVDPLKFIQ